MRQWDLNVFARTDSKLFLGSGCIYTNAWTNTVWDLKVWLWLALFYQKEICFVNSWKLIPSAVKSLAIWLLFSLRVYFVCYRKVWKLFSIRYCGAVSYVPVTPFPWKIGSLMAAEMSAAEFVKCFFYNLIPLRSLPSVAPRAWLFLE